MEGQVRRIVVDITTSYATGAGTKADVYLGAGGREFRLRVDKSDFDRGGELSYQLGEDANVRDPDRNDPRTGLPLTVTDIVSHPVYIRMVPKNERDDWNVENVKVRVLHDIDRRAVRYTALDGPSHNVWLGLQSGTTLHLKRSADDRSGIGES